MLPSIKCKAPFFARCKSVASTTKCVLCRVCRATTACGSGWCSRAGLHGAHARAMTAASWTARLLLWWLWPTAAMHARTAFVSGEAVAVRVPACSTRRRLRGCLVQLLGGFWPPEAEAETKRPASRAASGRSAWVRSRPPTVLAKRSSFGFREKPTRS
jgi:hypothetical protein